MNLSKIMPSYFQQRYIGRALAILYAGIALGMLYFWWTFHSGNLFSMVDLATATPQAHTIYLWHKSISMPEQILAVMLLLSAAYLWCEKQPYISLIYAACCGGAMVFTGGSNLSIGLSLGFFSLPLDYADAFFEACLTQMIAGVFGLILILLLARSHRSPQH